MRSNKVILVVPDLHFPASCNESIKKMFSIISGMKIDYIICLGDIYDGYSMSRFAKSFNHFTPLEEMEVSREMAEDFWKKMNLLFPRAKKFLLSGNHDSERIKKKIMNSCPEALHLVDSKSMFEFKNVETLHDYRDDLYLQGIYFTHGVFTKEGAHVKYYQDNVVFAHTHRSWILPMRLKNKTIFEFCAGYLGDPAHPFLSYTPLKRFSNWTKGFGIIDELGARFIAL